jgi:hypothetical protein
MYYYYYCRDEGKKFRFIFFCVYLFVVDFKERSFDNIGAIWLGLFLQSVEKVNECSIDETMFFRERIRLVLELNYIVKNNRAIYTQERTGTYQMGWTGKCVSFSRSRLSVTEYCGWITFNGHGYDSGHSGFIHHLRLTSRLIENGVECERFRGQRLIESGLRAGYSTLSICSDVWSHHYLFMADNLYNGVIIPLNFPLA